MLKLGIIDMQNWIENNYLILVHNSFPICWSGKIPTGTTRWKIADFYDGLTAVGSAFIAMLDDVEIWDIPQKKSNSRKIYNFAHSFHNSWPIFTIQPLIDSGHSYTYTTSLFPTQNPREPPLN